MTADDALDLTAVLIVADDAEMDPLVRRHRDMLDAAPVSVGPKTVSTRGADRVEIVSATAADQLLPGENAPAPSYLAALTMLVEDLGRARERVIESGTPITPVDSGFFVSGRDARGAGLLFTSVR
ncbi:hypothetical protein [Nocardia callitridis]|uniref:Glyoxalase-like domain-containing protein n=1 Tax=Nocardia callitridis TaxID=648753 RepID=A0ABP9KUL4_9NOCA